MSGSCISEPAAAGAQGELGAQGWPEGDVQSPLGLGEEQMVCRCAGTAGDAYVGRASAQGSRATFRYRQFCLEGFTLQIHLHVGENGARILTEQRLGKFRHQDSNSKE